MPISEKDRDMMRQVAAYFEGTRKAENPGAKYRLKREDTRSINEQPFTLASPAARSRRC